MVEPDPTVPLPITSEVKLKLVAEVVLPAIWSVLAVTLEVTDPTDPVTLPATEPTDPTTFPATDPTAPVTDPTDPVTFPATDPTEPTTFPATEPTAPVTDPTAPVTLPTDPTTLPPTFPVTEPTAPVTDPTDPLRFPVMLPVILEVRAVVIEVAALVPAMKWPPAPPGAIPPTNKSLPMLPATVKSPLVVSCQTAVANPAAVNVDAAGGVIDQPVVVVPPKLRTLVAVNVAPPDAVIPSNPPQVSVHAPDAQDIVAAPVRRLDVIKIGFVAVPVQVNALLIVCVVAAGR